MEQRTRILHHTRSKTPIILSPTNVRPRVPASSSLSTLRHEKAPLASLDKEFSNVSRHHTKSRHYSGTRSSSAGRQEQGSRRIVSREVLRSEISDWSSEDDDRTSPSHSVPLRRHTMGSTTRPRKNEEDSPEHSSELTSPRLSSPPALDPSFYKQRCLERPKDLNWVSARENVPKGPTLRLPSENGKSNDDNRSSKSKNQSHDLSNASKHVKSPSNDVACWTLPRNRNHISSPSCISRHIESPSNNVTSYSSLPRNYTSSPTALPEKRNMHSNLSQQQTNNFSDNQSRPTSSPQVQRNTVPTSISSQLTNRNSVNLSSPVTLPTHSFSVSSNQQPHHCPQSPISSNSSGVSSPSPLTSPTTHRNSPIYPRRTSSSASDSSWKTDPRRRPLQACGEFDLSPGDDSRDSVCPPHPFIGTSTPVSLAQNVQVPRSLHVDSSPTLDKSETAQIVDDTFILNRHGNSSLSPDRYQEQPNNSNRTSLSIDCHTENVLTAHTPSYKVETQPPFSFFDPVYSNTSMDASFQNSSGSSLSSSRIPENVSHPSDERISHTRPDVCFQGPFKGPSQQRQQKTSPNHYEPVTQNHRDGFLPRQELDTKPYSNGMDHHSLDHKKFPRSIEIIDGRGKMIGDRVNDISKPAPLSKTSEGDWSRNIDLFEPNIGSRFCRKRDSYRLATQDSVVVSQLNQSIEFINLENGNPNPKYSVRSSISGITESRHESRRDLKVTSNSSVVTYNYHGDKRGTDCSRPQNNHNHTTSVNSSHLSASDIPEPFVRGARTRDSYRMATSNSNPDLTCIDQDNDIFISCEDILESNSRKSGMRSPNTVINNGYSNSQPYQWISNPLTPSNMQNSITNPYPVSTSLKMSNADNLSRIKRNSLRLATASLSDLSVILDEIDIDGPPDTPMSNHDSSEHPSPIVIHNVIQQSPVVARSLGRSGSSVSSRNSSSFGSFYSCQSIGHMSAKNSPNHTSSHSSPRIPKAKLGTPDSIHKLIIANNAHDSGISQSSEDTNSIYISTNTSIGSADDVESGLNHFPLAGSLNRKRPMYYWTRQSPYPHQNQNNTIPASWRPSEPVSDRTTSHRSPRYPKSGSIRSYGSSSSVESGSSKTKPNKNLPLPSHLLQRYGCGLDGKNPLPCGKGSNECLPNKPTQAKQQNSHPRGSSSSSGKREDFRLPIPPNHRYRPNHFEIDFDAYVQPQYDDSSPVLESPNADTPRSPPSLGRPRRKLYAGFDSQPLPMDSFMSDSSSVYTGASCSSRGTDLSGQPDSGNFDESFYSIDNRSVIEDKDCTFEASLTPKDFMNLSDIRKNSQLHDRRSNSLYSTSTTKEGDGEDSDDEEEEDGDDIKERTMTSFQHHHTHHPVWPGQNYGQSVATSVPMTFTI